MGVEEDRAAQEEADRIKAAEDKAIETARERLRKLAEQREQER